MNTLILMSILSLIGLGIIYYLRSIETPIVPIDPDFVGAKKHLALGFGEVHVPENWLMTALAADQHAVERLDLKIPITLNNDVHEIDVGLVPASRTTPSAYLLDALYIHKFSDDPAQYANGLVGRKLISEGGFANESIWYDPIRPQPFVAKCVAPIAKDIVTPNCLETRIVNKRVSAVVKFPEQFLPSWKAFDAQMRAKLELLNLAD